MAGEVSKPITLPPDWSDTERGNVWAVESEEDKHLIYVRLDGNIRLEISIVPMNYPALNIQLVEITDEELGDHLIAHCGGWYLRKANLEDPRFPEGTTEVPWTDEHESDYDVEYLVRADGGDVVSTGKVRVTAVSPRHARLVAESKVHDEDPKCDYRIHPVVETLGVTEIEVEGEEDVADDEED